MENEQKTSITETKLNEIATKSSITLRELKELVFQYQRTENKSCKEENDKHEEAQRYMALNLNDRRIRNEMINLDLEFAELKPKNELLKKGKYHAPKTGLIWRLF
jgi:hypothetical protein